MKPGILLIAVFFLSITGRGQESPLPYDSVARFYYPNGILSSEGMMREGKPDGYWKAFYENGIIKSEGNRKHFELDSLWKFYNTEGTLILEMMYKDGRKNGVKTTWLEKEIIKEYFVNDIKQGQTFYYNTVGYLMKEVPFVNGLMEGTGKEYSRTGDIVTVTEYRKGYIVSRMNINRYDKNGLKQGRWITFWDNGGIYQDGSYKNGQQHGYVKWYSEKGDLMRIEKYTEGVLQQEAEEIQPLEADKAYYPNGKIHTVTLYRNGKKEGISREFSSEGELIRASEYHMGILTGEGLVLEDGDKTGYWKEFYDSGNLRAEGMYIKGAKTGQWEYYHENGQLEQTGKYGPGGKPEGTWSWYFESGRLHRQENYYKGKRDGFLEQYDAMGSLVEKGEYIEGMEHGFWIHRIGDYCDMGSYREGLRTGLWQSFKLDTMSGKTDSILMVQGNYIEDLPDGEHTLFWDNGKTREKGVYALGKKEGNWITYNYDGTIFLITTFLNGNETRYDGVKIKPPIEQEESP